MCVSLLVSCICVKKGPSHRDDTFIRTGRLTGSYGQDTGAGTPGPHTVNKRFRACAKDSRLHANARLTAGFSGGEHSSAHHRLLMGSGCIVSPGRLALRCVQEGKQVNNALSDGGREGRGVNSH